MGNVLINGRTAVHAGSGGTLTTVDVCRTTIGPSVVPIPYTNIAKSSDADKTAASVIINGNPACIKSSTFAKSCGDEAGDKKGVSSGTITEKAEFISASNNVFFEGVGATRQGDMMVSNNMNTAPMPLVQGGAGAPPAGAIEGAEQIAGEPLPDNVEWEVSGDEMHFVKGVFEGGLPDQEEKS